MGRPSRQLPLLLTERETMDLLGVSRWFMNEARRTGRLPHVRLGPATIRYAVEDIARFVKDNARSRPRAERRARAVTAEAAR